MEKKKMSASSLVCLVLSLLFVGIGVGVIVVGNNSADRLQKSYEQNEQTLKDLRAKVEALKGELPDEEEVEVKLHSAASAGAKVAEYQTKYAGMDVLTDEEEMKENAASIGTYMKDKSNQVQWYRASSSTVDYVWKFETTYSFKESEVPVLWTCYTNSATEPELLAYAKGMYYATDDMFGEMEYVVTDVGNTYLKSNTTDAGDGSNEKVPDSTVTVSPDPELEQRNQ